MQLPCVRTRLSATDEDVVDGNVDWRIQVSFPYPYDERMLAFWRRGELTQLDNVANNSHDQEAHADGLGNAQELALVGCAEKKSMSVGLYVVMLWAQCVCACLAGERGVCSTRCDLPRDQEALRSANECSLFFLSLGFATRERVKTYACYTW